MSRIPTLKWRSLGTVLVARPRVAPRLCNAGPRPSKPLLIQQGYALRLFRRALSGSAVNGKDRSLDHDQGDKDTKHPKEVSSGKAASPPKDDLSIVFTDIVKSTEIWETDAEAMVEAMKIHDSIMRELATVYEGYEVKQNGDGFMFAFQTALCALQFCLAVQQRLLDQEWPDELTEIAAGETAKDEDGHLLFRGLRLRMSAHWGKPVCVWNEITERMDYLGPVVNRAARFVEVTEGGQTVVSRDFLLQIQKPTVEDSAHAEKKDQEPKDDDDPTLNLRNLEGRGDENVITDHEFEVRLLGEHQFKGLSDPEKLYFIIPKSLHGRLDFWPKHKHVAGSKGNIFPGTI